MSDFSLPHIAPIKFVDLLLSADEKNASVKVSFEQLPTLGMLIEAAAQSSSGIKDEANNGRMGFLVSLKNIKLLQDIKSDEYVINVELVHKLNDFQSIEFKVVDNDEMIAKGTFAIILQ